MDPTPRGGNKRVENFSSGRMADSSNNGRADTGGMTNRKNILINILSTIIINSDMKFVSPYRQYSLFISPTDSTVLNVLQGAEVWTFGRPGE